MTERAQSYVYFVGDGAGHVKIGWSVKPRERVKELQTSSPRRLEILLLIPGEHSDEVRVHEQFAQDRVVGEWFRRSRGIEDFVSWAAETLHPGPASEALLDWADDVELDAQFRGFLYRCHEVGC